jgi:hypothetical protein
VDVGAATELFSDALLGSVFVADERNDSVVRVAGEVGKECPLK